MDKQVEAPELHATVADLSRRVPLATFSSAYKLIRASQTERFLVRPSARAEVRVFAGVVSLMSGNWNLQWREFRFQSERLGSHTCGVRPLQGSALSDVSRRGQVSRDCPFRRVPCTDAHCGKEDLIWDPSENALVRARKHEIGTVSNMWAAQANFRRLARSRVLNNGSTRWVDAKPADLVCRRQNWVHFGRRGTATHEVFLFLSKPDGAQLLLLQVAIEVELRFGKESDGNTSDEELSEARRARLLTFQRALLASKTHRRQARRHATFLEEETAVGWPHRKNCTPRPRGLSCGWPATATFGW